MTRYAVTGANGHFGHHVIDSLLARGIAAGDVTAIVRTRAKAADLADRGVDVREGDYSRPETLPAALAGVDRLLLVSGSEVGQRIPQHTAVVDAAKQAGVGRIAYTSVVRADTSALSLAAEHKATEATITASGLTYTFLRNSAYIQNYTGQLGQYLASGQIVGAAGDGRISAAARSDMAEAAAIVLIEDGHENATYEIGGPAFTMAELAAAITAATGTPVTYTDLSAADYTAALVGAGLDEGMAQMLVGLDLGAASGDWETDSRELARLLGRPTTPLVDVIRREAARLAL